MVLLTNPVLAESASSNGGPSSRGRERKEAIRACYDALANRWDLWRSRNAYFHQENLRYLQFLIPRGATVLELGSATGSLLTALTPAHGIGVDFSPRMVEIARRLHPHLSFKLADMEDPLLASEVGGPFDYILLCDAIGNLDDIQSTFSNFHKLCTSETRVVIAYHSGFWEPILRLAEWLGLKSPTKAQNWLSASDIAAILALSDFEEIWRDWRILCPRRLLGLGPLVNRFIAPLPLIRQLCVRHFVVLRSLRAPVARPRSASVIVPCRNERGNIEAAVRRIPRFAEDVEIVFIEGHSRDGTLEEINRVIATHPDRDIKMAVQTGIGKGDAVHLGCSLARGEVLIILDADLTVAPEDLPKFYDVLASGKGEFVNGSRLVYPMEDDAMRTLNFLANKLFSVVFSFLLNQRITDTLCGTKALRKESYLKVVAGRSYFGDFDPFGDFDLIFGAAKQNLKMVEIPVRYSARNYGETQISRFRHGWLLLRMVFFAIRKLKTF
jgi:SAM-dependent methyltransferase